ENLPLLRAFEDDLALRRNLGPGRGVDAAFLGQQVFQRLTRFLSNRVPILHETDLAEVSQRVRHGVGQLVQLVAADSHSTALYLRASSVFTFLNISAYWAPVLRISSE